MEVQNGKIKPTRILTAVVGSYPKPDYLYRGTGRELLDTVGMSFSEMAVEVGQEEFKSRLDRAAQMAIEDQNTAGIDIVTDGEERRGHYVLYVLRGLGGIEFENLRAKSIRAGRYVRELPVVVDEIRHIAPILIEDFKFTRQHAQRIPKINLPGPSTVVDSVFDAYYNEDLERLAWAYADAIRSEVEGLVEAGCRVIQFDDPVLLRYPDRAKAWGLAALQACYAGLENRATYLVHICRGYPDKPLESRGISYKANQDYFGDVLAWLSTSTLDGVSIEGAQSQLDLSVLPAIGTKLLMLGVLDVGENVVESVHSLVKRGEEALGYLPAEQLILGPDCGMVQLTRAAAQEKLGNMVKAVNILNGKHER